MRRNSSSLETAEQLKLIRKYLKFKLLEDNVSFRNHSLEWDYVYNLLKRTVTGGESHSALIIGPRGCGKTTLLNSVLQHLSHEGLLHNVVIVRLNGLLYRDEKVALRDIAAQMHIATDGLLEANSFAANLLYLVNSMCTYQHNLIFVLDEFHMFCRSGHLQTLLYSLFDNTQAVTTRCVLGLTNQLDVMELLEKRVKSRFSHRHLFMFPNEDAAKGTRVSPVVNYQNLLVDLLCVPEKKRKNKNSKRDSIDESYSLPVSVLERCKIDTNIFAAMDQSFARDWNAHIKSLAQNDKVIDELEKLCYYTVNEQIFRNVLFQIVCKISPLKPYIDPTDLAAVIDRTVAPERRIKMLQSLSVLELSLVIAMMHGADILDGQPVNFEMVLHRYTKFASTNSSTQTVPRPVILKAFEHLQSLEIILPVRGESNNDTTAKVQKEFKLYSLAIPHCDIKEAAKGFKNLPTEISQWACNSID